MLGRKLAYNIIISAGARIIGLALSLITLGFITRYLGQEGFGYYATIMALLYFASVLTDLGLYSICVREISKPKADEKKIASNAFTLKAVVSFALFVLTIIIVFFLPYVREVKLGVAIAAAGFWFMSLHQVLMGIFQKYLRTDKTALAEFLSRAVQLGLVAFFVWKEFSFFFIVSVIIVSNLINFALTFFFSRKYIPISLKFDFTYWESILKESLPLGLAIIFTVIYFRLDTIMLSLMKPAGDVGIYNLAYKFLESLLFFPSMFVGLVMPLMSKYAFSDKKEFNKITKNTFNYILLFIIPLIVGTYFLSEEVVVFVSGNSFVASAGVLNILIIAVAIIFVGILFSNMIISLKKQKTLAYIFGFGALFNLIANLVFIPRYSYHGAAWTTVCTELLVSLLMIGVLYYVSRAFFKISVGLILRYLIAGFAMALSLYYFASWPFYSLILLGALVYFFFVWILGGIKTQDLKYLIFNR